MRLDEMRLARRRLEELDQTTCDPDTDDVLCAFFGRPYTSGMLFVTLLDVLNDADMDEWPDETLDYYDVVRLPKDAEGETIHVGDAMRLNDTTPRVFSLALYDDGWRVGFCGEHGQYSCLPKDVRHHHKPTVEELLDEMYSALDDSRIPNGSESRSYDEIISEYANKIREMMQDDR